MGKDLHTLSENAPRYATKCLVYLVYIIFHYCCTNWTNFLRNILHVKLGTEYVYFRILVLQPNNSMVVTIQSMLSSAWVYSYNDD